MLTVLLLPSALVYAEPQPPVQAAMAIGSESLPWGLPKLQGFDCEVSSLAQRVKHQ